MLILLMLFFMGGISAQETRQLSAEAEALLQCFHEIYGEKIISGCTANVNWNINAQWRGGSKWLYFAPWYDYERTNKPDSEAFQSTDHASCNAAWWTEAFSNDYVLSREDFKEILTGIQAIPAKQRLAPVGAYDLMGRPWVEGRHGLYIKNGKKYIK